MKPIKDAGDAVPCKATPKNKRANFQPVIASSDPASGRPPWIKRGHPLFRTLRPHLAGRTASLLLLFRTRATPGLLRYFAPRNDDPARSETAGGRSQRRRNKGALQAFFQASPKLACFAPSLSKQNFGGFVGFQGVTRFPNVL